MNKSKFWTLIEKTRCPGTEQQYQNILSELSPLSTKDICRFGEFVSLYAEAAESPATYIACKLLNGSASDDTELYFRLWLVAQGRDFFLAALKNPDSLVDVESPEGYYEFEMLLGAVYNALELKGDNALDAMGNQALSELEVEEIVKEIETDMDWTDSEDSLWKQAPIRAPKLYAKYS